MGEAEVEDIVGVDVTIAGSLADDVCISVVEIALLARDWREMT